MKWSPQKPQTLIHRKHFCIYSSSFTQIGSPNTKETPRAKGDSKMQDAVEEDDGRLKDDSTETQVDDDDIRL